MSFLSRRGALHCARRVLFQARDVSRRVHSIRTVGVVGLGLMGHGIAQIAAQAGYQVTAVETSSQSLETGMKRIALSVDKVMAREVKAGKMTPAEVKGRAEEVLAKITPSTQLKDISQCDLIVEVELVLDHFTTVFWSHHSLPLRNKGDCRKYASKMGLLYETWSYGQARGNICLQYFLPAHHQHGKGLGKTGAVCRPALL